MPFHLFKRYCGRAVCALLFGLSGLALASDTSAARPQERPAQASLLIQSSPLAGSQFHALPEIIEQIRIGDPLTLQREPGNPHDRNAIQVLWQGHLLGFVPRRENKMIARAMDRNEPLIARVVALHPDASPWRRLRFEISMPLDSTAPETKPGGRSTP